MRVFLCETSSTYDKLHVAYKYWVSTGGRRQYRHVHRTASTIALGSQMRGDGAELCKRGSTCARRLIGGKVQGTGGSAGT
ncbi:hypothetical protein J6590_073534 [Homalodisca vitripennis]|nr:hypothetical protein J6590_073534 [Homalodisca vitripennis]